MGTGDAAEMLGLGVRAVYRLIDTGELPAYKFGRGVRLRGHDIERFIDRSRVKPGD